MAAPARSGARRATHSRACPNRLLLASVSRPVEPCVSERGGHGPVWEMQLCRAWRRNTCESGSSASMTCQQRQAPAQAEKPPRTAISSGRAASETARSRVEQSRGWRGSFGDEAVTRARGCKQARCPRPATSRAPSRRARLLRSCERRRGFVRACRALRGSRRRGQGSGRGCRAGPDPSVQAGPTRRCRLTP